MSRLIAVSLFVAALLPSLAAARCDLPANASSVYGYAAPNGQRCRTLEEAEALLRVDMPLGVNAFPEPGHFDLPLAQPFVLGYRPYGALGVGADVLISPPAATTSSYRAFVRGWPPVSPLAVCTIAGCDSSGCASPELERQRLQCQFDETWGDDARYCWTRSGSVTFNGAVSRFVQASGVGNESGSLLFAPSSSTANDSGAQFSVTAQSCPALPGANGERAPAAVQTFTWGAARQDAVSCGAGSTVNPAANAAGNACRAEYSKQIIEAPQFSQTPNQCSAGNPCHPGNGNKSASVNAFDYGRIRLDLHYSSLRQLRSYAYIDGNWSHSFAKRLLTPWNVPSHLSVASPEIYPLETVTIVFVQDEQPSMEIYRRDGGLPAGTFRATSSLGRVLRYFEDGVTPPYFELTYEDGLRERYDRAGRLTAIQHADDPRGDLTISYRGRAIVNEPAQETAHLEEAFWRIDRITDASGRYVSFHYVDPRLQKLERIVADDGATELARLVYDGDGRLAVLNRYGQNQQFLYNETAYLGVSASVRGSWLTGIVDEDLRRYATYAYDDWGRATASWHGTDAERVDVSYPLRPDGGQDDSRAIVRTAALRESTYTFAAGHPYRVPASISDPAGTVSFEYHPVHHRLSARIDKRGVRTEIEYNAEGSHEVARTEAKGRPEQRRRERDWNYAIGRMTAERLYADPPGGPRTLLRDRRFRYAPGSTQLIGSNLVDPADGRSRTTGYVYCAAADVANPGTGCAFTGQLSRIDGPRSDIADITHYRYYTATALGGCGSAGGSCWRKGDLRSVTNALGQVTEILAYDRAGRPARVRDPNGTLTDYSYHARGWLLTRSVRANADGTSSPGDAVTTLSYDHSGNVTQVIAPDNAAALSYTYDSAHRVTAVHDAAGNRVAYTLTPNGERRLEQRFTGSGENQWQLAREFDELDRLVRQLDAFNRPVVRFELDDAANGILNGYDANGNPRRSIDGRGVQAEQRYDGLNRLVESLQDFGGTGTSANALTQLSYDAADQLTGVTDPDGVPTTYVHDRLGDLRQELSRDAGNRSLTYDLAGNRLSETDARGVTATHVYDALNRRVDTFYPDASRRVRRDYDVPDSQSGCTNSFALGRLSRITDASGSTTYCYDRRGNVTRKRVLGPGEVWSNGLGYELSYTYDRADLLKSITYPHGAVVSYLRNASGRVSAVHWQPAAGGAVTALVKQADYYPFGPLKELTFGNARQLIKRYDRNFAIDQIESTLPGGLRLDFDTDVLGNITQIATTLGGAPQRRYTYDALNRLTQMRDAADTAQETFTYSPTGDRTGKQIAAQPLQPYSYASGTHRLASIAGTSRSYDANGNTTTGLGISTYPLIYDDTNRLATITQDGQGSAQYYRYAYNGLGQRTRKSLPGAVIDTVYDEAGLRLVDVNWTLACGGGDTSRSAAGAAGGGSQTSGNCTRSNPLRTEYIYLDGLPIAIARYAAPGATAQLSYLETDHLGTPRVAADATTQAVQWRWDLLQTAFGDHAPAVLAPGFELNMRYPGQHFDVESGLNHNYFRDYDPRTGRYIESDPIGLRGGANTYSYVGANSLAGVDMYGLQSNAWGCAIGGAAGALIGGGLCSPTGPFAAACATAGGALVGGLVGCGAGLLVPEPPFPTLAEPVLAEPWVLSKLERGRIQDTVQEKKILAVS